MKKMIAVVLFVVACTDATQSKMTASQDAVIWNVRSKSGCSGSEITATWTVCAVVDPANDVLEPGQAAAQRAADAWLGSCEALQGQIGTPNEGSLCVTTSGDASNYYCRADAFPTYEACTP